MHYVDVFLPRALLRLTFLKFHIVWKGLEDQSLPSALMKNQIPRTSISAAAPFETIERLLFAGTVFGKIRRRGRKRRGGWRRGELHRGDNVKGKMPGSKGAGRRELEKYFGGVPSFIRPS
jgi:hypothetical protein